MAAPLLVGASSVLNEEINNAQGQSVCPLKVGGIIAPRAAPLVPLFVATVAARPAYRIAPMDYLCHTVDRFVVIAVHLHMLYGCVSWKSFNRRTKRNPVTLPIVLIFELREAHLFYANPLLVVARCQLEHKELLYGAHVSLTECINLGGDLPMIASVNVVGCAWRAHLFWIDQLRMPVDVPPIIEVSAGQHPQIPHGVPCLDPCLGPKKRVAVIVTQHIMILAALR